MKRELEENTKEKSVKVKKEDTHQENLAGR
jgi:hypothetical protein